MWGLVKKLLCQSLILPLFCFYIQYGIGNAPMQHKYIILYHHRVNNIGRLWILHVQTHKGFPGVHLYYCHSQTTAQCVNIQNYGGDGGIGRSNLGSNSFCSRTCFHSYTQFFPLLYITLFISFFWLGAFPPNPSTLSYPIVGAKPL